MASQARSLHEHVPCGTPKEGQSVIEHIRDTLLPAMIQKAQNNYRNGELADCTIDPEEFHSRRREVIMYCQDHKLRLAAQYRDSSGNAPIERWLELALPHLALPQPVTVYAFSRDGDTAPYIRFRLS